MLDRLSQNSAASSEYLTLIQLGFLESKYRRLMRRTCNVKKRDYDFGSRGNDRTFIGHVENACRSLSGSRHHSPSGEMYRWSTQKLGQARRTGPRVELVKDVDRSMRPGESKILVQDRRAQFLLALRDSNIFRKKKMTDREAKIVRDALQMFNIKIINVRILTGAR